MLSWTFAFFFTILNRDIVSQLQLGEFLVDLFIFEQFCKQLCHSGVNFGSLSLEPNLFMGVMQ